MYRTSIRSLILVAAFLASPSGFAGDSPLKGSFDYADVSRAASINGDITKAYGVWPEAVAMGELLRDLVAKNLAGLDRSAIEPTGARYTILLGSSQGVQEIHVGTAWISDGNGVAYLGARAMQELDGVVLSDFPTPFKDVEWANRWVSEAGPAPEAVRQRFQQAGVQPSRVASIGR